MTKPTVEITGGDDLLIALSGKFKKGLEDRFLKRNSVFLTELDKASVKVFQAMATGMTVNGLRANPVIGTHQNTPSFLAAEGADWEPLRKDYFKRKKRLMSGRRSDGKASSDKDVGSVKTTAFWQYKGELKRFFARQSKNLTRISNNAILLNSENPQLDKNNWMFSEAINKTNISLKISGGFKNSKPDSFDFKYTPNEVRSISATRKTGVNAGSLVRSQDISKMTLTVEYNLFQGFKKHVDSLMGIGSAPSPEDYIAGIQFSTNKKLTRLQQYRNKRGKVTHYLDGKGNFISVENASNNPLAHKLFYRRDGQLKQRQLIQPYMRYYVKRILKPLASKLIKSGV